MTEEKRVSKDIEEIADVLDGKIAARIQYLTKHPDSSEGTSIRDLIIHTLTYLQDKQKEEEDALRAEAPTTSEQPNEETGKPEVGKQVMPECPVIKAARAVVTMWDQQAGRIYEGMGLENPRVLAIEQAIADLHTSLSIEASGNARETTKEEL